MKDNQPTEKGPTQTKGGGNNSFKTDILAPNNINQEEIQYGKITRSAISSCKMGHPKQEERLEAEKGLKKLGWLSVCQKAAYMSILMAIKILKNKRPERLHNELTEVKEEDCQ